MDEFTVAEKDRINRLYGTDFADITPDDVALIARFERWKAINEAKFQAEIELKQQESQARIEATQAQHEQAMNNLRELQQAALKRLERIEDGI